MGNRRWEIGAIDERNSCHLSIRLGVTADGAVYPQRLCTYDGCLSRAPAASGLTDFQEDSS
jgi:hypothetical protein